LTEKLIRTQALPEKARWLKKSGAK